MQESLSRFARRHSRTQLDVYVNKIIGDEPHLARVRDISAGGVYLFKLLEPTHEGQHVGLEIMLPDTNHVIWAVAEVVREDAGHSDGVALRFVRIAESDRELIKQYVGDAPSARAAA